MPIRSVLCLVAILMTLAACSPAQPGTPGGEVGTPEVSVTSTEPAAASPATSSPTRKSAKPKAPVVPETLRFTGTTVDGKQFDGSSLAGRPVLLWFWAPWCPVCRGQVSQVEKIASEHQGSLTVVGVGSLDDAKAIRAFARDVDGVTHLVDESGDIWKHFRVKEQSSFVLLDASGEEVFTSGYGGTDKLDKRVADVVR